MLWSHYHLNLGLRGSGAFITSGFERKHISELSELDMFRQRPVDHGRQSECLTISLRELVASAYFSKCTFSYNGKKCDVAAGASNLRCANAAKISLLLAQTCARFGDNCCDDDSRMEMELASLNLDNFFVKLSRPSNVRELDDAAGAMGNCDDLPLDFKSPLIDGNDVPLDSLSVLFDVNFDSEQQKIESLDDAAGAMGNCDDLPLDFKSPLIDENDVPLDFLSVLFDENFDSEQQKIESLIETSEESSSVGKEHSSADENEHIPAENRDQSSFSYDKDKFDKINAVSGIELHWTILGMEIKVDKSSSSASTSLETDMKHLGSMILEVFSPQHRSQTSLSAIFNQLLALEESVDHSVLNVESDRGQRCSKVRRYKEKSVFSTLLEVGHYPVSVCRLVSDMTDIGIDGMAGSPFTTLADVVEDLEQMSAHPRIYLHDPEDESFSSNLRFGLGCYGRTRQVTSILKVASSLDGNIRKTDHSSECAECMFVTGVAGSGKTFLLQSVGTYLESQGWIVLGAKFEMGLERESRNVVLAAFDKLLANLVSMRNGRIEEDIEYSLRATRAISDVLDRDSLSSLSNLLPNIKELVNIDGDNYNADAADSGNGYSYWRLIFLLSSLLGAVLSVDHPSKYILLYFDDIQWSDSTMLSLMSEIVISMGGLPHARKRFLFVGMYRDNEVDHSHPLTSQYDVLERNQQVNITSIDLPSFSENDLIDMTMAEMRLPRRLVIDFCRKVYRKAGQGHPLSVVQVLNSLVRDSVVVYRPTQKRYDWDRERLNNMQTWDTVASLIVSNLASLPLEALDSLRLLSCIGTKVHKSIIRYLGNCSHLEGARGIASSLPIFINAGILESSDSIIVFSHDLIRQQVYDGVASDQRQKMHLSIGICLGSKTSFDTHPIEAGREHDINEERQEAPAVSPQSLVQIATNHVNKASYLVVDYSQRTQFARWNLCAAQQSRNSNYQAALHYYKSGIAFLGSTAWGHDTHDLSYSLHKGAAFACLALGNAENAPEYASEMIKNVTFEHSLEARCTLIQSLESSGKSQEAVAMALAVLRQLGFDIPLAPQLWLSYIVAGIRGISPSIVKQRMRKIDKIASQLNLGKLIEHEGKVDKHKRDILKILESFIYAGGRLRSPHVPVIVCEMVNYSLEQGLACGESALSFCYYGYLKMWLEDDYLEGRRWGVMALEILEKSKHSSPFTRTRAVLHQLVLSFGRPIRESAQQLFNTYELGMKFGDVASACTALVTHLRWLFLDGYKLSSLRDMYDLYFEQMFKYNRPAALLMILDRITVDLLLGVPCEVFSIFDGMICDENSLLADALVQKNLLLVMGIYYRRFFGDFFMGNYRGANKWSKLLFSHQKYSQPPILLNIIVTAASGIVAFRLYREGGGEIYFKEGKQMLDELEKWLERSEHLVKSKFLLLQAEYYAANCEVKKSKDAYEVSIRTARNYGRVHEQGLAYELMGHYKESICEYPEATECFKNAFSCYMDWGAVAKATKIREEHLDEEGIENISTKHKREW